MREVFLRTPFNYDSNAASDESGLACKDVSLAKQQFADECDINTIARNFGLSGELPVGVRMPTSGDFSQVMDFQTAMNAVVAARESFDAMPARVRARFHNDPAEFIAFCDDPENRPEALKLGLIAPQAAALAAAGASAAGAATPPAAASVAASGAPSGAAGTVST